MKYSQAHHRYHQKTLIRNKANKSKPLLNGRMFLGPRIRATGINSIFTYVFPMTIICYKSSIRRRYGFKIKK